MLGVILGAILGVILRFYWGNIGVTMRGAKLCRPLTAGFDLILKLGVRVSWTRMWELGYVQ